MHLAQKCNNHPLAGEMFCICKVLLEQIGKMDDIGYIGGGSMGSPFCSGDTVTVRAVGDHAFLIVGSVTLDTIGEDWWIICKQL